MKIEEAVAKLQVDENFQDFVEFLFQLEGGYSDSPTDLGGRTNYGVTQGTLNQFLKQFPDFPIDDVKNLKKDNAEIIYYLNYYIPAKKYFTDDDDEYNYNCFDMCVNSGYGNMIKVFYGLKSDVDVMYERRKAYYENLAKDIPAQRANLKGWLHRVERIQVNYGRTPT